MTQDDKRDTLREKAAQAVISELSGGESYRALSCRLFGNETQAGALNAIRWGKRESISDPILVALKLRVPEHRSGIRVRMTRAEAEQVASGVVPVALRARVAGAVACKGDT